MKLVGINIHSIRKQHGYSLQELADKVGISSSMISQIENGKTSPSLSTLKNIANALDTTIGTIIGENIKTPEKIVLRQQDRKKLKQDETGVHIELLTSSDPYKQMEPLYFVLEKDAVSGLSPYNHYGQEFLLVIKGKLEITLNDNVHILNKGDSMYFNSYIPHLFKNISNSYTEVVWVVTPPTF